MCCEREVDSRQSTVDSRALSGPRGAKAPSSLFLLFLLAIVSGTVGCGKKGDPLPPLPRGARAVSDLAVEQEGGEAVLTFTYPDRLLTGQPLTDLAAIAVYRVVDPSASLTAPKPGAPGGKPAAAGGGPKTDEAPAAAARKAAAAARLSEDAFLRDAVRVFEIPAASLVQHTRGAAVVFRDPLAPLLKAGKLPASLAWSVVSVRRTGDKSPLSNFAVLAPAVPPGPPVILAVTPEEGRICLEWLPPATDMLGKPVENGGYFVYRRVLPEEEYEAPVNAKPVAGTAFVDTGAPYGQLVYTLRAILPNKPKVEGAPADEAALDYRDVFPPPAPARLDALPEAGLVRLVWDPVPAPDLAGYIVFRAQGTEKPERLNAEPMKDSFTTDTTAKPGTRYRYTVRAVDKAGNMSAPSPEAIAEPL
jgi:hypothetical protein